MWNSWQATHFTVLVIGNFDFVGHKALDVEPCNWATEEKNAHRALKPSTLSVGIDPRQISREARGEPINSIQLHFQLLKRFAQLRN
jgi:hypothetical protein